MTTTTDRPAPIDVSVTANRLRTVLGWLDDNAAHLPPGMVVWTKGSVVEIDWFDHDGAEQDEVARKLTHLLGPGDEHQPPSPLWSGTIWSAEGDRPELTVHQGLASRMVAAAPGGAA